MNQVVAQVRNVKPTTTTAQAAATTTTNRAAPQPAQLAPRAAAPNGSRGWRAHRKETKTPSAVGRAAEPPEATAKEQYRGKRWTFVK